MIDIPLIEKAAPAADYHRFRSEKFLVYYERSIAPILRGEMPYPIDWHIYPSNVCNHLCTWCWFRAPAADGHIEQLSPESRKILPREVLLRAVRDAVRTGAVLIHFSGGGEPLINKATLEAMALAQQLSAERVAAGGPRLDVALSTNGRLLTPEVAAQVNYIRVSLNAGTPEQHHATNHAGEGAGDWHTILDNIRAALPHARQDIGLGFVVDHHNYRDIEPFCEVAAELFDGQDSGERQRFVHIRPAMYSPPELDAEVRRIMPEVARICKEAQARYGDKVRIHAVSEKFEGHWTPRSYHRCRAVLTGVTLRATGDFAVCQDRVDKAMTFGHQPSYKDGASFEEVWHSEEHRRVVEGIHDGPGGELSNCPRCVWNTRNRLIDAMEADDMRIALV